MGLLFTIAAKVLIGISLVLLLAVALVLESIVLVAMLLVVLVISNLLAYRWVRRAEPECTLFLNSWAQENNLTLLRCRRYGILPSGDGFAPSKIVFRAIVVDADGILWKGWAFVVGRSIAKEFVALRVELRLGCPWSVCRPSLSTPGLINQPLWDHEFDGGSKLLARNVNW
jgi:hypothetical protein